MSAKYYLKILVNAALFQQTNGRAHGRATACFTIPRCETGCDASSHKSALLAENVELPYLWLRNDGGTEPDRGHSVSFSLVRIPFRGKVARTISARHALLSE